MRGRGLLSRAGHARSVGPRPDPSCGLSSTHLGFHPRDRVFERHRPRDANPLHEATSQLRQHRVGFWRFNTFGKHFKPELFGHGHDRGYQFALILVPLNARHKAAVDLEPGDREAPDIRDRSMPSSKIIQINAAAQFGEPCDIACDDVVVALRHDRFQNLDTKAFRQDVKTVELPADPIHQLWVAQFRAGKVDPNGVRHQPGPIPRPQRCKSMKQHGLTKTP